MYQLLAPEFLLLLSYTCKQLHSTTPKELSPGLTAAKEDVENGGGEETQQMELVVAEMESDGQKTPEAESDVDQEKEKEKDEGKWLWKTGG